MTSVIRSLCAAVLVMSLALPALAQGFDIHFEEPQTIAAGASKPVVFSFTVTSPTVNSVTLALGAPAGVTILPSTQTSLRGAGFPPLTFTIFVAQNAPAGSYTIPVNIAKNGVAFDMKSITFQVPAPATPEFSVAVTPPSVALSAGETRTLTVSAAPSAFAQVARRAAADVVTVTVGAANGVTVTPSSFTVPLPGTQAVAVAVSPSVTGRTPLTFTATAGGITHVAHAEVQAVPAVLTIVPSTVAAPSRSTTLRVAGTNFSSSGTFVSAAADLVVERTIVYSPTLADVVVSVPEGAAVGPRRLDFRNPDALSVRSGTIFVVTAGGIGAPLGVTTAAIVFPVEGTIVGDNEAVYPRAMLATSGSGTITGTWSVDGVPFDRFTTTASVGSVEVRTHVPIPPSSLGAHRITLVIETPSLAEAPAVAYRAARESVTQISFYEPADRAVVENNPRIAWSLVAGATAYEIELLKLAADGKELSSTRIRTTQTALRPGDAVTGMVRFRVRPLFPGDVRGKASRWSTAAFLPSKATLKIDEAAGGRVAWSGGMPGMMYRVELRRRDEPCFDAVTFAPEYRLPAPLASRGCDAVRVRALTPSGKLLGESDVRQLPASFAPQAAFAHSTPRITATMADTRNAITVRWREGDERDVALLVDGVDVTSVVLREPGEIRYEPLVPFRVGRHVAALATPAGTSEWSFTAEQEAAAPPAPAPLYVLAPSGTVTWASHPTTAAPHGNETYTLSSKGEGGDVNAGTGASATGNLNYNGSTNPASLVQTSRDWVTEARVKSEGGVFASARLGYTVPDFTDAAKYLVSGAARTGVIARAGSSLGTISYYQPIDPAVHGVLSATPQDPRIRALALSTPEGRTYMVRFIGVDVRDRADVLTGATGETARTYGIFARYTFSPTQTLLAELAHGTREPGSGSTLPSQHGNAARLTLSGTAAATSYVLNVSKVDRDFVTPANRVFTAGFNDRLDADLTLARTFGKAAFTLLAGRYMQARAHDTPHGSKDTAELQMVAPLTARVALDTLAGFSRDSAEKTALLPLGTDRLESHAATALTETLTRIVFSQGIKWSRMNDTADRNNDVTTHELTASASGTLWPNFVLVSSGGFTRTKASPLLGTTTRWMLSLTPSIALPARFVAVRPSITVDRSSVDVTDTRSRSEVYGTTLDWQPPWMRSFVSAQLSGTLTRSVIAAPVPSRTQSRAVLASLTIQTKKQRGMPMFSAPPALPGTVAPAPPDPVASH